MKKADFDRRRFLKNSAKLVAGATAAASIPERLVTAKSDDYTAVNHPVEQSDNCESDFEFNNWDYTLHCEPKLYCEPRSEVEVVDLVKQTYARGGVVRAFGAGHSWSPLVPTSDTLISLRKLKTPVTVDTAQMRATVPAGMRIKNVIKVLRDNGLGMQNLGSITRQRIAGAISTGTHGTGLKIGNLSTQITAMKLINGLGEIRVLSEQDPEFAAARISLGALGIISQVTIQCRKDYNLLYKSEHRPFKDLQHTLDYDLNNNERLRLYWFSWIPEDIQVMTMNETTAAATKESGPAENPTVQAVAPDTYSLPYWQGLGLRVESNKRKGSKARLTWFNEEKVKPYDQALTTIMPPPHQESEYAIPVEKAADAVRALQSLIKEKGYLDLILVEVRFVAQDNIMLSPSHDRPVCYVGGYIFGKADVKSFFKNYETLMKSKSFGGRPHWGKHLTLSQQEARNLYPKTFDKFNDIRKELDPKGIFANDFIHNLFG
jgi:L-gulonolactone oxidase